MYTVLLQNFLLRTPQFDLRLYFDFTYYSNNGIEQDTSIENRTLHVWTSYRDEPVMGISTSNPRNGYRDPFSSQAYFPSLVTVFNMTIK